MVSSLKVLFSIFYWSNLDFWKTQSIDFSLKSPKSLTFPGFDQFFIENSTSVSHLGVVVGSTTPLARHSRNEAAACIELLAATWLRLRRHFRSNAARSVSLSCCLSHLYIYIYLVPPTLGKISRLPPCNPTAPCGGDHFCTREQVNQAQHLLWRSQYKRPRALWGLGFGIRHLGFGRAFRGLRALR